MEAPPSGNKLISVLGPQDGCPPAFAACLTLDDTLALTEHLEKLRSWAVEAWLRCGPVQGGPAEPKDVE